MNGLLLTQNIPRGLLLAIMIVISAYAPYVKAVEITRIQRHAGVWIIEGTITINSNEVPTELSYNHDPNGFLLWWEQHINDVLTEHGKKNIYVSNLELTWEENGDIDIIRFHAELIFGFGHTKKT